MDQTLQSERVIAFRPELARYIGSIEGAILYQQLCHWQQYAKRSDGFIYKSAKELSEETTIGSRSIHRIRERLVELGLIEVKKEMANKSATYHYRILVVPTTLLTSAAIASDNLSPSSDTVSLTSDKNDISITKNTHKNTQTHMFDLSSDNLSDVEMLYKGWLIEMVIGHSKYSGTAEDSRLALLESAAKKTSVTPRRVQKMELRLKELGFDRCAKAITNLAKSSFHRGDNERKWKASIEWLFNTTEKTEEWANK